MSIINKPLIIMSRQNVDSCFVESGGTSKHGSAAVGVVNGGSRKSLSRWMRGNSETA